MTVLLVVLDGFGIGDDPSRDALQATPMWNWHRVLAEFPHCRLDALPGEVIAFATTEQPIEFGAADRVPVDLIFLVASPTLAAAAHLQAVARVSRLLRQSGIAEALRGARSQEELAAVLRTAETALNGAPS